MIVHFSSVHLVSNLTFQHELVLKNTVQDIFCLQKMQNEESKLLHKKNTSYFLNFVLKFISVLMQYNIFIDQMFLT